MLKTKWFCFNKNRKCIQIFLFRWIMRKRVWLDVKVRNIHNACFITDLDTRHSVAPIFVSVEAFCVKSAEWCMNSANLVKKRYMPVMDHRLADSSIFLTLHRMFTGTKGNRQDIYACWSCVVPPVFDGKTIPSLYGEVSGAIDIQAQSGLSHWIILPMYSKMEHAWGFWERNYDVQCNLARKSLSNIYSIMW